MRFYTCFIFWISWFGTVNELVEHIFLFNLVNLFLILVPPVQVSRYRTDTVQGAVHKSTLPFLLSATIVIARQVGVKKQAAAEL
jgi:hypothetical protein